MFNLRILSLNCRSLISNIQRIHLQEYLSQLKPDIVLLQETRLGSKYKFHIWGYNVVYIPITNSNTLPKDVGTAIAFRCGVHHIKIHCNLQLGFGTFAEITMSDNKILIGSYYLHTQTSAAVAESAFSELAKVGTNYDTVIIGGDFNADCNSPNSANGKGLLSFISSDQNHHLFSPLTPTFRTGSIIDHFLLKDDHNILCPTNCTSTDLFSDHYGILLRLGGTIPLHLLKEETQTRLCYEGVNWMEFNELVDLRMNTADSWCLTTNADVDKAIEELTGAVNYAIEKFLVKPIVARSTFRNLPCDVILLVKGKNRLLSSLTRENRRIYPREEILDLLKYRLQTINKELDRELKRHFSKVLSDRLKNILPGPNMFKEINRITGRKGTVQIGNMRGTQGNMVGTPEEVAMVFRDYYSEIFEEQPPPHVLPETPITPEIELSTNSFSVSRLIKELNGKKSAGPDGISNYLIKRLSPLFVARLAGIYDACLWQEYFPAAWKLAKILPFYKKGEKTDPSNFRPISLVNCLGKILEKIILSNLLPEIATLKLIPNYQAGFRAGHSCVDLAAALRDTIIHKRSMKLHTAVCLLDIKKAFDSVWIAGLCWKLAYFGISRNLIGIITSFLSNRAAFVSIGNCNSPEFPIKRGVPQGTVLGPQLYNLYVADQPSPANRGDLYQFADDTANVAYSASVDIALRLLQKQNDNLEEYYAKWGIAVNGTKSELIIFRKDKTSQLDKHIVVAGETVTEQPSVRYLGIEFHRSLHPGAALRARLASARKCVPPLNRLLCSKSLDTKVKKLIYTLLIRPVATYGSPLWSHSPRADLFKLEAFERIQLRKICSLYYNPITKKSPKNKVLYSSSKVPPIASFISKLNSRFRHKYKRHSNEFFRDWALTPSTWLEKGDLFTRSLRYNRGKDK